MWECETSRMTSVAVLSLKGGVGKTTVVLGLADRAQKRGLRTLVVDADPQANATDTLINGDVHLTLGDVLADGRPGVAADAILTSDWGKDLFLLPSEPALEHRNRDVGRGSVQRLRTTMQGVGETYDLILFDCPPSLGELTRNALAAADAALVVTEPGYHALRGCEQALDAIEVARDASNLRLRTAGILLNRVRPRVKEQAARIVELQRSYPRLLIDPTLPERTIVAQATGAAVPVATMAGAAARDTTKRYDAVLTHLLRTPTPVTGREKEKDPR